MKIFVCLLVTVCTCNAKFLNFFGEKGDARTAYNGHGNGGPPKVIKLILDDGHGGAYHSSGDNSYASGYSYGPSGNGHSSGAKIFKVINQNSVDRHGGSSSHNSQWHAFLPQILQYLLQNDNDSEGGTTSGDGDDLNSHPIDSNSRAQSFYSGGNVLQSGSFKIKRLVDKSIHDPLVMASKCHNE